MSIGTAAHTRSLIHWLWDWAKSIIVALVVWFFLRTFLVEAFRIPSGSMENTRPIRTKNGLPGGCGRPTTYAAAMYSLVSHIAVDGPSVMM